MIPRHPLFVYPSYVERKSGPPRRPTYGYFDIAILPIYRGVLSNISRSRQPVATLISFRVPSVNGRDACVRVHNVRALGWRVNRFRWRCVTLFSSLYISWGVDTRSLQTPKSVPEEEREDWFRFDMYRGFTLVRNQTLWGRGRFPAYRDAFRM